MATFKTILLTKGKSTIVDEADYDYLSQWKWREHLNYAVRSHHIKWIKVDGKRKKVSTTIRMSRTIMGAKEGEEVDHINGDKLDNRRSNLRLCTHAENMANQPLHKNNVNSKIKGVYRDKNRTRWSVYISVKSKQIYIGSYDTKKEAAIAYNNAASHYHGEFARLNAIEVYQP